MSVPWMPLYVADYLADTGHLSAAEHGAYLMLIMHYWRVGSLPKDEMALARISRMKPGEWRRSRDTLAAFFGEGWAHERIENELKKSSEKSERRAEAGARGGSAKSLKRKNAPLANAAELPEQTPSVALASSSQSQSQEETAAAVSLAAAAAEPQGFAEDLDLIERRCREATGWADVAGFSAIAELIRGGEDFEGRVLPMLRTLSAEFRESGKPPPRSWVYAVKAIRDPTRKPRVATVDAAMVWVQVDTPAWAQLTAVKRESFLRSMLKPDGTGKEGIWWPQAQFDQLRRSNP